MKRELSNEERLITDKAWERLKGRLERDGLLEEPVTKRNHRRVYPLAIAAMFILMVTAGLLFTGQKEQPVDTLTARLFNDTPGTTYVSKLDDGSVIYLSENTTVKHSDLVSEATREVTLDGEAFFDIRRDESKPFVINAGDSKIEVLGTSFEVACKSGETVLSVKTGLVRITQISTGKAMLVKEGERAIADAGGIKIQSLGEYEGFKKYKSRMHFKDESLGNISEIINRNFTETVIIPDPSISGRELTATFSEDNPEAMVRLICSALNLNYTIEGRVIKIGT